MKVIWVIAYNTFREIIRDRILYGIIVFALLLMAVSVVLGQLSFAEQARISANFGFTGIHLSCVVLAIFVGSTLVAKEIEKKTIMTLLARPITRIQFLIGKSFGLSLVIATVSLGLALVLLVVFLGLGVELNYLFLVGLHGIFLESMVLMGFALLFSSFTRPVMVVSFSAGLFFIGHWMGDLEFFSQKSQSASFILFAKTIRGVLPNLERFNWRALGIYNEPIGLGEVSLATLNAILWFALLIMLTGLIFRRKDFG